MTHVHKLGRHAESAGQSPLAFFHHPADCSRTSTEQHIREHHTHRVFFMPPFIPLELIEAVLAYLHDDTPTLRVCALVGRSWVQASQRHIFDSVSLGSQDQLDAFVLLLRDCLHLRPLVRYLTWYPGPDIGHHEFPLAALFPRVHTLFHMEKQLNCAFILGLSSLKKLELGHVVDLADVGLYPNTEGALRRSCPWSELVMEEVQMHVLDWLAFTLDFPQLVTLELPLPEDEVVHAVLVRFLRHLEVLQKLRLNITSHLIATREWALSKPSLRLMLTNGSSVEPWCNQGRHAELGRVCR
jgi:hypothetical protein